MLRRFFAFLALVILSILFSSASTTAAPAGIDWVVAGNFQDDLPSTLR